MTKDELSFIRGVLSDAMVASGKTRDGLRDLEGRAHVALGMLTTKAEFRPYQVAWDEHRSRLYPKGKRP